MKQRDFLVALQNHIQSAKTAAPEAQAEIFSTIDNLIDWQFREEEGPPICGLYLSDMETLYGFNFQQLQYELAKCLTDRTNESLRWGFASLLQWLYEVSHTSIGDVHGDLIKDVQIRYWTPEEISDEQQLIYDKFWTDVENLLEIPSPHPHSIPKERRDELLKMGQKARKRIQNWVASWRWNKHG